MSCVYILGREYYKHFIYNNKTFMNFVILYSALTQWYVSLAHVQFLAPVANFILLNLRNYLRKKKKHRPPLPPSMSEQFYVLSVVHFEWMWLIFSFSVIL